MWVHACRTGLLTFASLLLLLPPDFLSETHLIPPPNFSLDRTQEHMIERMSSQAYQTARLSKKGAPAKMVKYSDLGSSRSTLLPSSKWRVDEPLRAQPRRPRSHPSGSTCTK